MGTDMSHPRTLSRTWYIAVFALSLLLASCGGGSGIGPVARNTDCSKPTAEDAEGCTFISLSDAPGDFLTYTVDVTSLTLTRSDGTTVQLLPATTRVDFAQYSSLSEFLTAAAIPPGIYVSGVISLSFSGSDIEAEDNSGNAVKLTPVDQGGNALAALDLSIRLDTGHTLLVAPGIPHLLNVEFDLDTSNTVNNNTVIVQPFLVASVDPATGVEHQVRGPLSSVDATGSRFSLSLRPFSVLGGDYGLLSIYTTANTVFDIDQQAFTGGAGLAALQAAGATTAVLVQGQFDFDSHRFIADRVFAGSSVPGGTLDAVQGVVVSRSGNTLVMRGTTLYRAGQTAVFRDSVSVTLGTGMTVHQAGDPAGSSDISDISVGQTLLVFGMLTDTNPASLKLDAGSGFALLELTEVDGTVSANAGGILTLSLQGIQGRPVALFDFAGTGSSAASYKLALSAGLGSGIGIGDPVRAFGFVAPFGSAPPDFTARSLVDFVDSGALLSLAWDSPGTPNAFTGLDASSGILVNLGSGPILHRLRQGGVVTDLFSLPSPPTVDGSVFGLYAILQNGTVQVHLSFANFIGDLQTRLAAGAKVRGCFAMGGFDSSTGVMDSGRIAIILQ